MAKQTSLHGLDPAQAGQWYKDALAALSSAKPWDNSQAWTLIDSFLQSTSNLGQDSWYNKVQSQSLLFNLGLTISINCAYFSFRIGANGSRSLADINDDVVEAVRFSPAVLWSTPLPSLYAQVFLRRFFSHIQAIICANKGKTVSAGSGPALSTWLAETFGIAPPLAIGMAAVIIATVATAAGDRFCDIGVEDFMRALTSDRSA